MSPMKGTITFRHYPRLHLITEPYTFSITYSFGTLHYLLISGA